MPGAKERDTQCTSMDFYVRIPGFSDPAGISDLANYHALPDDWVVATTDVVESTKAVAAGHYKRVNTAGASVISAVSNELGLMEFPFVFGGDGAALAVHESHGRKVTAALAAVSRWVRDHLDLELRTSIFQMREIRSAQFDVLVGKFQVADEVAFAMFAGGGIAHAETRMKSGDGLIAMAPPGTEANLTGLSCRWQPVDSRNGSIVSILVAPGKTANPEAFMILSRELLMLAGGSGAASHPLPEDGLSVPWLPSALWLETSTSHRGLARVPRAFSILIEQLIGVWSDRTGRSVGRFSAKQYRRDLVSNSDFRKFDDGLKLTLDLSPDDAVRLEQRLTEAEEAGVCCYGLHKQSEALITCIVPSPVLRNHIHFIDGASGGYVAASVELKRKLSQL